MITKTFSLQSDFDGLTLQGIVIEPQGEVKGVVQILHGMCEYKERYQTLMEYFAANGFVAVCHDQRGHGDSVKNKEDLGYFYEKKGGAIVDDAALVTTWIRQTYENLPITLFGHSMGSMVARCYLQNYDTLINGAIICGSPTKNPLVGVAILLTKTIALFRGERHRSKMLAYLSTGKGNNNFPGEEKGAWLSQNRENIQEFYSNPKGSYRFTCNGFENLFHLMKNTYDGGMYAVNNLSLPIHFVSGADDAVLGGEKNFQKAIDALRKVGYQNVSGKLYKGLRHEIHNEVNNQEVLADLVERLQT